MVRGNEGALKKGGRGAGYSENRGGGCEVPGLDKPRMTDRVDKKLKSKEEMVLPNSPVLPLRMPGTGTPHAGHR